MAEQNYFKGRLNKYSDRTNPQLLAEHARLSRIVAALPNLPREQMSQHQLWQSGDKENLAELQHEMQFRRMNVPEVPKDVRRLMLAQQEIELKQKITEVQDKLAELGDDDAA